MLSSTLKRSAATPGVMAGLLAAAAPVRAVGVRENGSQGAVKPPRQRRPPDEGRAAARA